MSKFICTTSITTKTHSSSHHQNRSKYTSALEKLDERTKKWQPKRVVEENRLKQLHEQGKCDLFQPLSSYRYYHIHGKTPMDVLDDLIDYAKVVKKYTIDTEDQPVPSSSSKPALLQIEYVYENNPSILLIIEMMHLPKQSEPTFIKIKQLLKTIFSKNRTIFLWGSIKKELKHFCKFELFDEDDINSIEERNTQDEFKRYFNQNYPSSPDIKREANETYSLQFAIYKIFNQWLTKRYTLANFGCGLDLALDTIIVPKQFMNIRKQVVKDEEEIRELMTMYALNDCLSTTKLVNILPSTTTIDLEIISEDELILDYESDDSDIHIQDEVINSHDDDKMEDKPVYDISTGSHDRNDSLEMISDDDIDDISLPEIMKVHFTPKQRQSNEILDYNDEQGHVENDRQNDIGMTFYEDEKLNEKCQQQLPLTRNQKKSRKKRAKRYRFEIIRKIYHRFTIRQIKNVLIYMNIHYVNINVVGNTLFIGVKNEPIRKEIEGKLDDYMFTEKHYQRISKRTNRTR